MTFTPSSSVPPATVTVAGTVAVSNFPATQPVSGTVAVSSVAGTVTVDASGFTVPVSGPLTDAQLRASAVAVDGSAVTQPVSADTLPLPDGAATEDTLADVNGAAQDTAWTAILEREKVGAG